MRDFDGKSVFVTGGSAGVGLACARQFLALGARVAISGRDPARLQAAAAELDAGERLLGFAWDVADTARATAIFDEVEAKFGALHVLVNNAGCNERGALEHISPDQAARVLDTNFRAPLLLSRLVLPYMRRAREGAIVNVASLAGRVPLPHEACYSATKFGLRAFSLALAQELEGSGIGVSVVSPGPIETGFIMEGVADIPDLVFSQPMSSAEDVAAIVVACARDGRPERALPVASGWLTTVAYLFPGLSRALRPMLERRGRRAKLRFAARHGLEL